MRLYATLQGYTGVDCSDCLEGFTETSDGVCALLDVSASVDTTSGVAPTPAPTTSASSHEVTIIAVVVAVGGVLVIGILVGTALYIKARVSTDSLPRHNAAWAAALTYTYDVLSIYLSLRPIPTPQPPALPPASRANLGRGFLGKAALTAATLLPRVVHAHGVCL